MIDPTRSPEMLSCSAIDLAEIQQSGRSPAEIVGSNPTLGMGVFLL
jgi:hypothetical protein